MNCHSCVNASAQFAGIAALEGPQDQVGEMVAAFDERRKVIVEGLNALPGVTSRRPGGAFYAFPNVTGTGMSSDRLQQRLLEESGIAVISGTSFGSFGEGYLRFSYANSTENIRARAGADGGDAVGARGGALKQGRGHAGPGRHPGRSEFSRPIPTESSTSGALFSARSVRGKSRFLKIATHRAIVFLRQRLAAAGLSVHERHDPHDVVSGRDERIAGSLGR